MENSEDAILPGRSARNNADTDLREGLAHESTRLLNVEGTTTELA
jgi:hypothetical protein